MEIELGIIPGPIWTEACGHGGYVASYEYIHQRLDLYVYQKAFPSGKQAVCIRYGNDAPEYLSFHDIPTLFECGTVP